MTDPRTEHLSATQAERRYLVLSGLQWLPVGLVIPVMVLLMRSRGIELPVMGALFALYSAVVIALELPTGSLADVLGRRRTLLVSRTLSIFVMLGLATAGDPLAFGLVMVVMGVARALQSGPLEAWYVDTVRAADPEADVRRGISRAWAIEAAALAAGAVTGGLLPGLVPGLAIDGILVPFSIPYLVAASITGLGLVAVATLMHEPARTADRPRLAQVVRDVPGTVAAGLRLARQDRTIKLVLGASIAFGFALSALEVVSPVQFASLLGGEERASAAYGVLVTLAFLGTAAGSASAPRAATLVRSAPRAAAAATALIALALGGMATGWSFALVAALYIAVYLFAGIAGPLNNDTLHSRVDAGQRATLLSVQSLTQMFGGLVGNLVVPALAAISFGLGWLVAAGVVLGGAMLLGLLPSHVARVAARQPGQA